MVNPILVRLIASVAAMLVTIGMTTSLVPLRGTAEGFTVATMGVIAGCYYAGFLVGPFLVPALVARCGVKGAFASGAAIGLVGIALLPAVPFAIAWAGLRFVAGTGLAILYILVETGLNAEAANATRGRVLSAYLIASKGATIAGQIIVGALGIAGWVPVALAAAWVALSALILSVAPLRPIRVAAMRLRPLRLAKAAPLACFGCLVYGMAEGSVYALAPLFAKAQGFATAEVSFFMTALLIGGGVAQWPMGALSDRIDRRRAILVGACIAVAAGLLLGVSGRLAMLPALAGAALFGAGLLPLYGLCVAMANDTAGDDQRVELGSGLMLAYAIGAMAAPPGVAALMERSAAALPLSIAGMLALFALLLVVALRHRPRRDDRVAVSEAAAIPPQG